MISDREWGRMAIEEPGTFIHIVLYYALKISLNNKSFNP